MVDWLVNTQRCPGLFYGTPAQDGYLLRIRTPAGLINQQQGLALAKLCREVFGVNDLQITNRANLQLRGIQQAPGELVWQELQGLGLAACNPALDHLRNLMASPTAGVDPQELLDTRPLIQALDRYLQTQAAWIGLPAKFSIGLDGGGQVGVGSRSPVAWEHRPNDIQLSAVNYQGKTHLHLTLAGQVTDLLIPPAEYLDWVTAMVQAYLAYLNCLSPCRDQTNQPRLRQVLQEVGLAAYLQRVSQFRGQPLPSVPDLPPLPPSQPYAHLGVHRQRQARQVYLGVSLTLGQLGIEQFCGLLELVAQFGSGELRLTPWQTVILPNIPTDQVDWVLSRLTDLGLQVPAANCPGFPAQIVACAGLPGCASAHTHTQADALALAAHLPLTDVPINIHLTGCSKACAQPSPAEITLVGVVEGPGQGESYHLYCQEDGANLSVCQLVQRTPTAILGASELPMNLSQWLAGTAIAKPIPRGARHA